MHTVSCTCPAFLHGPPQSRKICWQHRLLALKSAHSACASPVVAHVDSPLFWKMPARKLYAKRTVQKTVRHNLLVRHSVCTLLTQLATASLGLGMSLFLARQLGPFDQGLYGVIVATAMLGGLCINLGTPAATTYAVSCQEVSPLEALHHTLVTSLVLGCTGAAFVALLAVFCADVLWAHVPKHYLFWAAALIPTLLATQLTASILQGAQAFRHYNTMALLAPATTGISTITALRAGGGAGAALACLLMGQLCAAAYGAYSVARLPPEQQLVSNSRRLKARRPWWPYFRNLLNYGSLAAVANLLAYASYRIDIFLLHAWLPGDCVGYYSVAAGVAERFWMLSAAINTVLFAHAARRYSKKSEVFSDQSTPMLVRHVLWLVAPVASAVYIAAPYTLPMLFGPQYSQAIAPLRVLLPGVVIFNVARILSQDFAGRNRVVLNVVVGAVCLALNVLANIVFIPRLGILGAAWASTLSYSADALIKLVLYTQLTQTPWLELLWLQPEDWRRMGRIKLW